VTADAIDAGAITSDKIFADAVNSEKIAADSISSNMLQSNSVTADKIAADLITVGQGLGKESAPASCTANMRRGAVEAYNVIVKWHEDGTGGNGFAITFERNPSLSGGTASASYDSARAMTVEANGNVPVNSIVNAINAARLNGDQLVVASRQPGFTSGSNTGTFGSGVADITCSLAGGVKDRIEVTTIDGGWITTGIVTADHIDADVQNVRVLSTGKKRIGNSTEGNAHAIVLNDDMRNYSTIGGYAQDFGSEADDLWTPWGFDPSVLPVGDHRVKLTSEKFVVRGSVFNVWRSSDGRTMYTYQTNATEDANLFAILGVKNPS